MTWDTSDRRSRLPSDWQRIRLRVLRRDSYSCQARDNAHAPKCLLPANEVDHIVPGDDHSLTNLQALCRDHHKAKTASEAAAARRVNARLRRAPSERHPGLL